MGRFLHSLAKIKDIVRIRGIARKLMLLLLPVALLPFLVGVLAWYGNKTLVEGLNTVALLQEGVVSPFHALSSNHEVYILTGNPLYKEAFEENEEKMKKGLSALKEKLKGEHGAIVGKIEQSLREYQDVVQRQIALSERRRQLEEEVRQKARKLERSFEDEKLYSLYLQARREEKNAFLYESDLAIIAWEGAVKKLLAAVPEGLRPSVEDYMTTFKSCFNTIEQMQKLDMDRKGRALKLNKHLNTLADEIRKGALALQVRVGLFNGIVSALAFLGAMGMAFFVARRFTRPIQEMTLAAQQIAQGNYDIALEVRSKDELGQLVSAINGMAAELKERSERNRRDREELERQQREIEQQVREVEKLKREAEAKRKRLLEETEKIAQVVTKAAEGDLSVSVQEEGLDELRELGRALNEMLARQRELLSQVSVAADQVLTAAAQVAESSQKLAEGASEQAASLEETSSSMEEVASMARDNAEAVQEAKGLMEGNRAVRKKTKESFGRLIGAMEEIASASERTQKIVKTIDEIAFQTNLLALNAAVEAARAGEAGAGFAVVAEEVRALAQRSAEAARQTAELIEDMRQKVNEGKGLLNTTAEEFTSLDERSMKLGEIMVEIATASREQAQGVDQIREALQQVDRVTQQVAASAEESASAAEEMKSQAESLKDLVGQFKLEKEADGMALKVLN